MMFQSLLQLWKTKLFFGSKSTLKPLMNAKSQRMNRFRIHARAIFSQGERILSRPGPPHYRCFTITLRHTTIDGTPLDEWSAHRRDLYLRRHNIFKRQTAMTPAGFERVILASERLQTHALDRAGHWDRAAVAQAYSGVLSEHFAGRMHRLGNHAGSWTRNLRNKSRNAS
jgi:hypothetical protein